MLRNCSIELPAPGVIHLWLANLDKYSTDSGSCQPKENVRELAQVRTAQRRQLLRELLCAYMGDDILPFFRNTYGKPFLPPNRNPVDLRFNMSSSHGKLAIALACGREVGIDIEYADPNFDFSGVCEVAMSADEALSLSEFDEVERRQAFYAIWSGKEAILKAAGIGLGDAMTAFTVVPTQQQQLVFQGQDFQLLSIQALDGYSLAVASQSYYPEHIELRWL